MSCECIHEDIALDKIVATSTLSNFSEFNFRLPDSYHQVAPKCGYLGKNSYIEEFKKQDISTKRKEIIESIKELMALIDALSIEDGIEFQFLKSKEINEFDKTEDDFLEAIIVYIENLKNSISQYLIVKRD